MITKMSINGTASYSIPVEVEPTKINYIYGANGCGKTTISRLIGNPVNFHGSVVEWANSNVLERFVYNRDFVESNFRQDSKLKGIFTLGTTTPAIESEIEELKGNIINTESLLTSYKKTLSDKQTEKANDLAKTTEDVYEFKRVNESFFRESMAGFLTPKKSFFDKCVFEQSNTSPVLDLEELKERHRSIYNYTLTRIDPLPSFDYNNLQSLESQEIFEQAIVGKSESQIASLINHLHNSDWVHRGLPYLVSAEDSCPFCQQPISSDLKILIEEFFDSSFQDKKRELSDAIRAYSAYVLSHITALEEISRRCIPNFTFTVIPQQVPLIREILGNNSHVLKEKSESPSSKVILKSLAEHFVLAEAEIAEANEKITEHNRIIANSNAEKESLKGLVWKYLSTQTADLITAHNRKENGNVRAIGSLQRRIDEETVKVNGFKARLRELESQITSVTSTVTEINQILSSFHFNGFKLAESEIQGHYKIVRPDNSDAKQTLSEGEFTFVTFLYFYHLVKGNFSNTGVLTDRVVVIDDPVSSLDSNVLFIVSNLVKSIINDCKNGTGTGMTKQVFVLTHNIYFHKEVSFLGSSFNPGSDESFWTVRKNSGVSSIKQGPQNKIQTTYELLWAEIRDPDNRNSVTIFNTLRRILEYYFKIIGHIEYERIVNQFEFHDQQACKALISWINDGSHCVNDDLLIDTELETVDRYLSVFKDIFYKLNHQSHYDMMMQINTTTTASTIAI